MTSLSILTQNALCEAILTYYATEQLSPTSSRQVTMQNWGWSRDQSTGFLTFLGDREQKVKKRLLNTKIRHFLSWRKLQLFRNFCWFFSHQKHLCFAYGQKSKAVCSECNADSEEGQNYNQCWQILKREIANFSTTTHKQCKFCFPSLPIFACDPEGYGDCIVEKFLQFCRFLNTIRKIIRINENTKTDENYVYTV